MRRLRTCQQARGAANPCLAALVVLQRSAVSAAEGLSKIMQACCESSCGFCRPRGESLAALVLQSRFRFDRGVWGIGFKEEVCVRPHTMAVRARKGRGSPQGPKGLCLSKLPVCRWNVAFAVAPDRGRVLQRQWSASCTSVKNGGFTIGRPLM